nr:GNAT family N-acetyltransferase [Maliibacterium massiliense]
MRITLRRARVCDAPAISRIHAAAWKHNYRGLIPQGYLDALDQARWVPLLTPWIAHGPMHVLLLRADGRAAGCIVYGPSREAALQDDGEIVSLYVHPALQKRGYGKALLRAALAHLRALGYAHAFLWVLEGNAPARAFYARSGFADTGRSMDYTLEGAPLHELCYRRALA